MDEKRFYDEKEETKQIPMVCPHCRQEGTFPVRWIVRNKKAQIPQGANEEDKRNFAKARSYMVRRDDKLACVNIRCRKPFEITSLQSLAFPWLCRDTSVPYLRHGCEASFVATAATIFESAVA